MLLKGSKLEDHLKEIEELYQEYLEEVPKKATHFGIIEDSKLLATGSIKCYFGDWYLRGCIVKPEYRGKGLQSRLIRERLEYIASKANIVRVGVFPNNQFSIDNIKKEGFVFEKKKKLSNGKVADIYKKQI
jgi:ribosomal protein S18 acetylase RimI-like enzyme